MQIDIYTASFLCTMVMVPDEYAETLSNKMIVKVTQYQWDR